MKFETENLSIVELDDVASYDFEIKAKCSNCQTETPKSLHIVGVETQENPNGRGETNCVWKCSGCGRQHSIDVITKVYQPISCSVEKYQPLVGFDCRGCEPSQWIPHELAAITTSDARFEVALQKGEWYDYDEDSESSVGISKLEHRFSKK